MKEQERQASVESALSQIVSDFGRKVSDDPIRLRNLLVDATGVDAMTLDAEINAVVAGAETQLPTTVTSGDATEQAEATQRLTAVLGPEQAGLAGWATTAWASVLQPGTSRPGAALGEVAGDATALPGTVLGDDATALPSAMVTEDATVVPGPTTRLPGAPGAPGAPGDGAADRPVGEAGDDRKPFVLIGAFFGLIALVIVVIVFATRGGEETADPEQPVNSAVGSTDDPGDERESPATTPDETTADTVADPGVQTLTQPFVVAGGVAGERSLTPGDRATTVDLTFDNTSGSAFEGHWLEASPAAFGRAPLASQDPAVLTIGDPETPVLAVPLALADGETATVSYTVAWTPAGAADLESAADAYAVALQSWIDRNGDPRSPSVSMTSAATSEQSAYTLTGVTQPANSVTVDGREVAVAADGSFGVEAELAAGTVTFELAATSPLGYTAIAPASVTFDPPAPEPTEPPQNAAPLLVCEDDYVVFEGAFEGYIFGVPLDCFSDPDGDALAYYSDIGTGAPPDQCPTGQVCWVYRVPENWDGTPFEITATIWAEDPEGLQSASGTLTMCLNCTP